MRRATLCALVLAATFAACNDQDPFMPDSPEPGLYMVLYPGDDAFAVGHSQDSTLYGLLVRTGTPLSTEYLRPESVTMTRREDREPLAWQILDLTGDAPSFTYSDGSFSAGNLRLPRSTGGSGGGAGSIRPGDTYDLDVVVDGTEIRGSVHVPERPDIRAREVDGQTILVWSQVAGADGYEVSFRGADGLVAGRDLGPDTTFVLDRQLLGGDRIWLTAYDANLTAYLLDGQLGRSGIDTGFGFVGAMTSTERVF